MTLVLRRHIGDLMGQIITMERRHIRATGPLEVTEESFVREKRGSALRYANEVAHRRVRSKAENDVDVVRQDGHPQYANARSMRRDRRRTPYIRHDSLIDASDPLPGVPADVRVHLVCVM